MESTLEKPAFLAAKTTLKATTILYWIFTALFCLQMALPHTHNCDCRR